MFYYITARHSCVASFCLMAFRLLLSLSVEQRYSHCHKSFLAIRIYPCIVLIQFTMNDIPQNPTNEAILQAIQSLQSKVESATKKEKKEAPLKKEGNQEQLDHSKKVSSLIESAIFSLDKVDVDNAKLHLQEALTELTSRQKLIKIADRSPLVGLPSRNMSLTNLQMIQETKNDSAR